MTASLKPLPQENVFPKINEDIFRLLPECKGDKSMLIQVWFNLIGNALKYSSKKPHPQVEVGAIDDFKTNIYYVRNNGTGFDMKYSNKLFGVFQRLHLSTRGVLYI